MFRWVLLLAVSWISTAAQNGVSVCDMRGFKIGHETYDPECLRPEDPTKLSIACKACMMPWAQSPEFSEDYTIRTGDEQELQNDPDTYTPGALMPIYLRTLKLEKKWAGLHIVATKGEEGDAVGDWELPNELKQDFQILPKCPVLTHKHQRQKLIRTILWFRAPPAGTGEIVFQTLLKQGYQGRGNFYYPAKKLVLQEASSGTEAPTPSTLVSPDEYGFAATTGAADVEACFEEDEDGGTTGGGGGGGCCKAKTATCFACQENVKVAKYCDRNPKTDGCEGTGRLREMEDFISCDAYCASKEQSCIGAWEDNKNDCVDFLAVESCNTDFTQEYPNTSDMCCHCEDERTSCRTFGKEKCKKKNRCDWRNGKERCDDLRDNFAINETYINQTSSASSSAQTLNWIPLTTLAIASLLRSDSPGMLASFGLLSILPYTSAHNWINHKSRADPETAYEGSGCPSNNMKNHITVNPGQLFQIEWSVGHGGRGQPHYWRMFKRSKESQASNANSKDLDTYLDSAPNNAKLETQTGPWRRIHMGASKRSKLGDVVSSANEIKLDSVMIKSRKKTKANDKFKQELTSNQKARDVRAEYNDGTFVSVTRFPAVDVEFQQDHEVTNIRVPEFAGTGSFVLMWNWKNNRDCINIEVIDHATVDDDLRYTGKIPTSTGRTKPPTPAVYTTKRTEHCQYSVPTKVHDCKVANSGAGSCVKDCKADGIDECSAVAIVPWKISSTWPFKVLGDLVPNECQTLPANDGDMICFSLKPGLDPSEGPPQRLITRDSLDATFHGTCIDLFEGTPASQERRDHEVGGQCLECLDTNPLSHEDFQSIKWSDKLIPLPTLA